MRRWLVSAFRFYFHWLCFFNQLQGRAVQSAQFILARLVFGELHQIAARQKNAEAFLLLREQQFRTAQLAQKFLRRSFRRVEIKPLLQIRSRRVRNRDDERLRLCDERQRLFQPQLRANVRRHRRRQHDVGLAILRPAPQQKRCNRHGYRDQSPPKPRPAVRNFNRRLDIADVVGSSERRCLIRGHELVVTTALTLTLSAGEREQRADAAKFSRVNRSVAALCFIEAKREQTARRPRNAKRRRAFPPLLGERVGVRVGVKRNSKKSVHPRSLRFSRVSKNLPSATP